MSALPKPRIALRCLALLALTASAAGQTCEAQAQSLPPTEGADSQRILRLEDALRVARERQPSLRQARAETDLAEARVQEARAPLLPQLTGSASYQRTTGNFVPRPGQVPRSVTGATASGSAQRDPLTLYNFFNFSLTANQLLYDFGAATGAYEANREIVRAQVSSERAVEQAVTLQVSRAFLQARAYQELVGVARQNLENAERHLHQTGLFVEAGARPEIDLVQVRADVANARLQLIQAENAYAIAKAAIDQAMGSEDPPDYQLSDETIPALAEETQTTSELLGVALRAHPDLEVFEHRARAQRMYIRANKGSYGPALSASTSLSAGGTGLDELVTNWNAGAVLVWPLIQGGVTRARVLASRAAHESILAEQETARLAVRFEVEQARLGVHAAKGVEQAAQEVTLNAEQRLILAEKRYEAGVGNAIELGDARLATATAQAQQVQAAYALAMARIALRKALGRSE